MNSVIVNKLQSFIDLYNIDVSRVNDISESITMFYNSLTKNANSYSSLDTLSISFAVSPVIDKDPISRIILQGYVNHNYDEVSEPNFSGWPVPVTLYFVVKGFFEILILAESGEYKKNVHDNYILLDALSKAICNVSLDKLFDLVDTNISQNDEKV